MGESTEQQCCPLIQPVTAPEPSLAIARTLSAFNAAEDTNWTILFSPPPSSLPHTSPLKTLFQENSRPNIGHSLPSSLLLDAGLTPPAKAVQKHPSGSDTLGFHLSFADLFPPNSTIVVQTNSQLIDKAHKSENARPSDEKRVRTKVLKYRPSFVPNLLGPSQLLRDSHIQLLRPFLPGHLQYSDWTPLFDTSACGFSLQALIRAVRGFGPSLLVVRDSCNHVFGAFLSEPLQISQFSFYGTGECFVFSLEPRTAVYPWDAGDTSFIHVAVDDGLTIGGGGGKRALWIDDNLYRGHSECSSTFNNEPLASCLDFKILNLEVWGFVT